MIATAFEYHAPKSIDAAIALLDQYGDQCKILSGGHSLIPILKLRLASPAVVIDIGRIKALDYIRVDGKQLRIGSLTTHGAIARSQVVSQHCALLADTARQIGDQQVRNRGTIGGSVTHADPAADWPAAMLALDAQIVLRGRNGERTLDAVDFFVDMLTSAVQPGEIVTEISLPLPATSNSCCYHKVPQSASGFALVGVAAQLETVAGICKTVSLGITGLAPKPFRARTAEGMLVGKALDEATVTLAAEKADAEAIDALEDLHASGEYRRHLARVCTKRALLKAGSISS